MRERFTRRRFLSAVGAGAAYLTLTNVVGCDRSERVPKARTPKGGGPSPLNISLLPTASPRSQEGVWRFRSRPDLSPPPVEVSTQAHDTAPGYIFVAPQMSQAGQGGSMIVDDRGEVVWFRPLQGRQGRAHDLKVQTYRGEPVLTWTEKPGEYVIFDDSYREIKRFHAGNGYRGDHHEFLITSHDTALLTIFHRVSSDLSSVGGPEEGMVLEGIAQEVDIETGEVLFEWHSLDHVGVEESYIERYYSDQLDYFHINSIDVDHDENLLISARNTCATYKIERSTGEVLWRLGGKASDFEMGPGTETAYQHDARRQEDATITIFDNGAHPKVHDRSRGIMVELDEQKMSAKLVREYTSPQKRLSTSQGNMQLLPNSNVLIGWGSGRYVSEFSHEGELLFEARFPPEGESYRAFRFPWSGHPTNQPAVAVEQGPDDKLKLYASWNGATEIDAWEVLAGPHPGRLEWVGSVPRDGFETSMLVQSFDPYVAVRAKDHFGQVLGIGASVKL